MSFEVKKEAVGKVFEDKAMAIYHAIHNIENGVCKRVDVDDRIKVYECKNVIRIDIHE